MAYQLLATMNIYIYIYIFAKKKLPTIVDYSIQWWLILLSK